MLIFRPSSTNPPATIAGRSTSLPGPACGKRASAVSDFQLVVVAALIFGVAVVGFTQKQSDGPLAAAPEADQVDTAIIARDEPLIWDALVRYGLDHGGRLPAFDSRRLPTWWMSYSCHPIFDYRYVLKSKYIDALIEPIIDWDPATFLRPVVAIGPDGRVKPVLRNFKPPNTSDSR